MWKLLQGLHKGRSWEWSALVRPAPQVACLDDDHKKTCVAGAISELHERLPWKCVKKYYPKISRSPQSSNKNTPDITVAVTADVVLNSRTLNSKDTPASRSRQTCADHPTTVQRTNQVIRVIQAKVSKPTSPCPLTSRDVTAEDPKSNTVQPLSRLSVVYTDDAETEDRSKGRCFCGSTGDNDSTKRHWKKWHHDFRQDFWAGLREPFGFVEALGWSTTLIVGLNLCNLWQPDQEHKTWRQQLYRVARAIHHDSTQTAHRRILDSGKEASNKRQPPLQTSSQDKKPSVTPLQSKEVKKDALTEAAEEWQKLTHRYTNMTRNSEARLLAKAGRYRDAFRLWQVAAEAGYEKAHYNMALCYEQGKGTKTDLSKAIYHYKMAAMAGHSKAKFNLAILQQQGQGGLQNNPQQVMELLQDAAESGLKQAQTQLGVFYTEEENRDWTKASLWFQRVAEQNDSMGQYYLGICYEHGWGVEGDLAKAAEMFILASESGHAGADFSLAMLYERGLGGLPQDHELALQLYKSSVRGGNQDGIAAVQRLQQQLEEEAKGTEKKNEELVSSGSMQLSDHQDQGMSESVDISRQTTHHVRSTSSSSLSDYIRQHLVQFGFTSEFDSRESYFTVPTAIVTKSTKPHNAKLKSSWQGGKTVPCFFIDDAADRNNRGSSDVEEETCYTRLNGGRFGNIAIATSS